MLVRRYHGGWIIVPAFTQTPVIADVIVTFARSSTMSSAWTTAVATTLRPARWPSGPAPALHPARSAAPNFDPSVKHQVSAGFCQQNIESRADR
jgi:hypothetical protein